MRKLLHYIAPVAFLALVFGGSLALSQTTYRALQLSQDTTGAFIVDTNFGVYFPGHILSSGTGRPAPVATGAGASNVLTSSGTDFSGSLTMGTSATGATLIFGQAFLQAPSCVAGSQGGNGFSTPFSFTPTTTGINFGQQSATGNIVNWICPSVK